MEKVTRIIMGIDPGSNGAVAMCMIGESGAMYGTAKTWNLPYEDVDIFYTLNEIRSIHSDMTIYLEKQGPRPSWGDAKDQKESEDQGKKGKVVRSPKTEWKFAEHYGVLKGIARALKFRIVFVTPYTWQKQYNLLSIKGEKKSDHKNRMKQFAADRFPEIKCTQANADALIIMEYGIKQETNSQRN